jgi:hypothetical protein
MTNKCPYYNDDCPQCNEKLDKKTLDALVKLVNDINEESIKWAEKKNNQIRQTCARAGWHVPYYVKPALISISDQVDKIIRLKHKTNATNSNKTSISR